MRGIVACVPNFSEGRRPEAVTAIADAIADGPNVRVLRIEMDPDHNRSVITFIASPAAAVQAALRGCAKASERIDLRQHRGVHPRIGATDVIPFVPVSDVSMQECVVLSRRLGRLIARSLDIPVYLYAQAAASSDRRELSRLRRGGFERLRDEIVRDPARKPDFGPSLLHPSAGATAVGARPFLIAFNVLLSSGNIDAAKTIAAAVRESGGGLPGVRALGLFLESRRQAQVSMNLTAPDRTGIAAVYQRISDEAQCLGVAVETGELIGLAPLAPVMEALAQGVPFIDIGPERIFEYKAFWALVSQDFSPKSP